MKTKPRYQSFIKFVLHIVHWKTTTTNTHSQGYTHTHTHTHISRTASRDEIWDITWKMTGQMMWLCKGVFHTDSAQKIEVSDEECGWGVGLDMFRSYHLSVAELLLKKNLHRHTYIHNTQSCIKQPKSSDIMAWCNTSFKTAAMYFNTTRVRHAVY